MQGTARSSSSSSSSRNQHSHHFAIMGGEQRVIPVSSDYPKLAAGPVGKQIDRIYRDRMDQFTDGGQYYWQGLLPYVGALASRFR